MDTKSLILKTALELFNRKGTENVTVRDIAKRAGISHGNLCYHYPTTNHIIRQLYFNLVDELDTEIAAMREPKELFTGARVLFDLLYKYKFLMLSFVDIMRALPDVHSHYLQLQERRRSEFRNIFTNLVHKGLMRPEIYPGFFDDFIVNMTILGDFWVSHAEILYTGKTADKQDHFFRVTSGILLPLLTKKGLNQFMKTKSQ